MTFTKCLRKLQDIGSALGRTRTCHLLCSWTYSFKDRERHPVAARSRSNTCPTNDARPGDREMLRDLQELAKSAKSASYRPSIAAIRQIQGVFWCVRYTR